MGSPGGSVRSVGGHLATARRFAALAFRPFQSLIIDVLGGVGLIGLQLSPFRIEDGTTIALVGLAIVVCLFAVAGYRLQRQVDEDGRTQFRTEPSIDSLGSHDFQIPGDPRLWNARETLLITVVNEGPTARFAASVDEVRPLVREDGEPLSGPFAVDELAWEHTIARINEIPAGGRARLKVATAAWWVGGGMNGEAWFFYTAESATYAPGSHGIGWRLAIPDVPVSFRLFLVNVDTTQSLIETYRVEFDGKTPTAFEKTQ
jgi:hypothetical protein